MSRLIKQGLWNARKMNKLINDQFALNAVHGVRQLISEVFECDRNSALAMLTVEELL